MESEQFEQNKKFFIIGIICLSLGLILFALSFYIFPRLIFHWRYQIPEFIAGFAEFLQFNYHLKNTAAGWLVFLGVFSPSIILFIIADIISNKIDKQSNKDYYANDTTSPMHKRTKVGEPESRGLIFKIILIIILVFVASQLFQWAIAI